MNFDGVANTLRLFASDMVSQKGAMVVIGSTESLNGGGSISTYCSTKHAVLGLARSAAIELGPHGARVNTICPGTIRTPMYVPEAMGPEAIQMDKELTKRTPLQRHGKADEVAAVARFLLSTEASYINGAAIVADGGLNA